LANWLANWHWAKYHGIIFVWRWKHRDFKLRYWKPSILGSHKNSRSIYYDEAGIKWFQRPFLKNKMVLTNSLQHIMSKTLSHCFFKFGESTFLQIFLLPFCLTVPAKLKLYNEVDKACGWWPWVNPKFHIKSICYEIFRLYRSQVYFLINTYIKQNFCARIFWIVDIWFSTLNNQTWLEFFLAKQRLIYASC